MIIRNSRIRRRGEARAAEKSASVHKELMGALGRAAGWESVERDLGDVTIRVASPLSGKNKVPTFVPGESNVYDVGSPFGPYWSGVERKNYDKKKGN